MSRLRCLISPILVVAAAGAASHTVWDGVYSKEQAARGQTGYNANCARCHGDALLGGETAPALVDADFLDRWNGKTVGNLVEVTRKSMPSDGPGKLSRQLCTDIAAYLLSSNNFPAGSKDLAPELDALNEISFQVKK